MIAFGCYGFITANIVSDHTGNDDIWFKGQAFAFFMYALAFRLKYNWFTVNILVVVTLAALLDELTGNAEIVTLSEYLIITLYILIYGINLFTRRKS